MIVRRGVPSKYQHPGIWSTLEVKADMPKPKLSDCREKLNFAWAPSAASSKIQSTKIEGTSACRRPSGL